MLRPNAAMRSRFSWSLIVSRVMATSTMALRRMTQMPYSEAFLKTVTPCPSTKHRGKIFQRKIERMASTASAPTAENATAEEKVLRRYAWSAKQRVTSAWSARGDPQLGRVILGCRNHVHSFVRKGMENVEHGHEEVADAQQHERPRLGVFTGAPGDHEDGGRNGHAE